MIPQSFSGVAGSLADFGPALANHLWQSTVFAVLAGVLTLVLRRNHARARYWLWMAASVKFLVPFALLIAIGSHLAKPREAAATQAGMVVAMEDVSEPFALPETPVVAAPVVKVDWAAVLPASCGVVWLGGFVAVLCLWYVRWRRIAAEMREADPVEEGRELEALLRLERASGIGARIRMLQSPSAMEPGVFGIARPVLAWPERISERLDDAHLAAVLAHEVCHVRRRDNLTATMHMVVEAVFWFYPLVWWLGARLVEERERACDEEVLELCKQPEVYAESILKVCEFCVESPLACVSGVTGADLKQRIVEIMTERVVRKLGPGRKLLLVAVGLVVVAVPLLLGQVKGARRMMLAAVDAAPMPIRTAAHAMIAEEQTPSTAEIAEVAGGQDAGGAGTDGQESEPVFEVASIRPSGPSPYMMRWQPTADGLIAEMTLKGLITYAYGVLPAYVVGGPDWMGSEQFVINAKFGDKEMETLSKLPPKQRYERATAMLRNLLVERFKLKVRQETKESAIYSLEVAKGGPKLTKSPPLVADSDGQMPPDGPGSTTMADGRHILTRTTMQLFAMQLERDPEIAREVVDGTGLKGPYDFEYKWQATQDGSGPSLYTALEEQLGLKLVARKGPVETLVIESAEKPSVDGAEVVQTSAAPVASSEIAQVSAAPKTAGTQAATTAGKLPEFDAATIKPASPKDNAIGLFTYPGGRIVCSLCTLQYLMMEAFGIQDWQISGGPNWVKDARYDVEAKPPESSMSIHANPKYPKLPPNDEQRQMLQSLLMDRFQLNIHREQKDADVYILSRGNKPLKLQPPKGKDEFHWAGSVGGGAVDDGSGVAGTNISMPELAIRLSGFLKRPVLDRTGLAGSYDFEYRTGDDELDSSATVGIITSMREIGLKLASGKGPVETIVIDHVERPSEN